MRSNTVNRVSDSPRNQGKKFFPLEFAMPLCLNHQQQLTIYSKNYSKMVFPVAKAHLKWNISEADLHTNA